MEKPLSLELNESREILVEALNKIQLHPVLLENLIKELYLEVQRYANVTREKEMKEYMASLDKEVIEEEVE
jgi:hypothetical protein